MATYVYDDFRITFTPRPDGAFDVRALDATGTETTGEFRVPLSAADLERAILDVARGGAGPTRDVGVGEPRTVDPEHLGAALADALLSGPVGAAYDRARAITKVPGRGLRLSLSLAAAPALLSVPWEFLFRRPRFLASQRQTPLVRLLDTGVIPPAAEIAETVRILGVIASPIDLPALAVDRERAGVERSIDPVRRLGRVQLDWLEPATTDGLRAALRDGSYHVLHFVGHSDFSPAGEGRLFLEDDDHRARPVDEILLANLLSDQDQLRLVVLNSCEGARTTMTDPYAGVATTLISLGVPAVVAMQFEISDAAAIRFAEELYLNLIGRQSPIDASVAEARKAVYGGGGVIEFATPVLYVPDPDVELFRFGVPAAPLPPPPPPGDTASQPAIADATPVPTPARRPPAGRRRALVVAAGVVVAVLVGVGIVLATRGGGDGDGDAAAATTVGTIAADDGPAPRTHSGFFAVQVLEPDGDVHLLTVDPADGSDGTASDRPGSHDTEPDWDAETNRLAFRRAEPSNNCAGLCYVVPGREGDAGKQVAQLVEPSGTSIGHAPAWSTDATLFYARTAGCQPGPGCAEELRVATFTATEDGTGFADQLSVATDVVVETGFTDVRDLDADPQEADRLVLADGAGVAIVDAAGVRRLPTSSDVSAVTYTADGNRIVAIGARDGASTLEVWDRTGGPLGTVAVGDVAAAFTAGGGDLRGLDPAAVRAPSVTPGREGGTVTVLLDDPGDDRTPVLALAEVSEQGAVAIRSASAFPTAVLAQGEVQAVAR
jgi:hypothetical protein